MRSFSAPQIYSSNSAVSYGDMSSKRRTEMKTKTPKKGIYLDINNKTPKGVRKYMIKKFQTPKGELHLYKQQNPKVRVNL